MCTGKNVCLPKWWAFFGDAMSQSELTALFSTGLVFNFQDTGAVRKVFTLNGKPVVAVADFAEDEVFIAYGVDKCSNEDFDLDMVEFRFEDF